MADTLFVKPAEGRTVVDPRTREPIPAEGREVPATSYWVRRLKVGDVVDARPAKGRKGGSKSAKDGD